MAKIPGLVKRGSKFSLRTFVPKDIVQSYGKLEVWSTLGTSDPREACKLAKLKAADMVRAFEEHRQRLTQDRASAPQKPAGDNLTAVASPAAIDLPRLSATLAQVHYMAVKERDVVQRADLFEKASADEAAFYEGKIVPLPTTEWMTWLLSDSETPLAQILLWCWRHWHEERMARLSLALAGGDLAAFVTIAERLGAVAERPLKLMLAKVLLQAEIDALADINKDDETKYAACLLKLAMATAPSPVPTLAAPLDDKQNPPLSKALADWIAEKSRASWTPRRKASCEATLGLFVEIVGEKRIADYAKADVRDYKAVLCDLPPNHSKLKETRGLGPRQRAERARKLNIPKMSLVNVDKQLTIVSSCFDWLRSQYDAVSSNPFDGATISVKSNMRDERHPFSTDDLRVIFMAPVYTGCESERGWQHGGRVALRESAKFWVPLLGLYSGARVNELCKLRVADIRTDDAITYIDINADAHGDTAIDAGLKSAASARQLPVHADLVSFGFLAFVEMRRKSGGERLFPELTPDTYGKLADGFGKHFARFLKALGIKHDKIDFHSFRHTWTDACRNSRISVDVIYALKGEALKGTLARYGNGKTDLEILAEETAKLKFKGLDLGHLRIGGPA